MIKPRDFKTLNFKTLLEIVVQDLILLRFAIDLIQSSAMTGMKVRL